jgi:Tfp pilus assembly PilM family ATPase
MNFIGIYSEDKAIKFAKVRKNKQEIAIENLRSVHKEDSAYLTALEQVESTFNKNFTTTSGLEASDVFIRILHMKLSDKKKIISALPFQMEGVIPFSWEESITAPLISKKTNDNLHRITTVTTKKSSLQNHIDSLSEWNIDPENTSSIPNALYRFTEFFHPEEENLYILYIGISSSCALCIVDKKMEISYPFNFSINHLISSLEKDLPEKTKEQIFHLAGTLDFQLIEPSYFKHTAETLFQLQKEIDRILSYFQSKVQNIVVSKVLLSGSFAMSPKLKEFIKSSIQNDLSFVDHKLYGSYDASTIEAYCIPIGLALDTYKNDEHSLQFRQKDFLSKKAFQKKVKSISIYFYCCAALTLSMFILGKVNVSRNEKKLSSLCQNYFPEYESLGNINEQIASIEKKLLKGKKKTSLVIPAPSVSEVLAWLSTHPKLSKSLDSLIPLDLIDIKYVKYTLVKHPQLNMPNMQTVAKLEMEFSSPSSRLARDFHDALLKGDYLIDEKKDISWEVKDSNYKTSFYLKNKGDK